jgi:hypothetical protein
MEKCIDLQHIESLWVTDNVANFEGYNTLYDSEATTVELPLNEITDNLDYFIERRIEYITRQKKSLNDEQKKLKEKLKLWKSLNT